MPAPLGVADLLAELGRGRRHLGRDAPASAAPRRPGRWPRRCSSLVTATSTQVGTRAGHRQRVGAEEQAEQPGHADGDAHPRDTGRCPSWPGCRTGRRSRSSRTARSRASASRTPCRCSSRGRGRCADRPRRVPARGRQRCPPPDQLREPLVEQRVAHPERRGPRRRRSASGAEISASASTALACASLAPAVSASSSATFAGPILSSLSTARSAASGSVEPDAPVEALADLAVVDLDPHRRDRQRAQRVADDQRATRPRSGPAGCPGRRCRCRPGGTRGSGPPAGARPARPSGSGSGGTGTAACRRSPARTGRTARSGRSAGRARRRRPAPSGSACSRRSSRPPWRSRPCAAAGRAARPRGSPAARSRTARTWRRIRSSTNCSIMRCGGGPLREPRDGRGLAHGVLLPIPRGRARRPWLAVTGRGGRGRCGRRRARAPR